MLVQNTGQDKMVANKGKGGQDTRDDQRSTLTVMATDDDYRRQVIVSVSRRQDRGFTHLSEGGRGGDDPSDSL
ncbi:hypothetical protein F2P81_015745 [Scophthalmus maximus]|uniref:Uncharacterized protein n=1 Tax=Scophthalmus maximus TaxID=52904 RepID=A0A6A4SH28_SCOMX|nr:hypothetical protein F2P81_015745 [Scophthalmus maximus]